MILSMMVNKCKGNCAKCKIRVECVVETRINYNETISFLKGKFDKKERLNHENK